MNFMGSYEYEISVHCTVNRKSHLNWNMVFVSKKKKPNRRKRKSAWKFRPSVVFYLLWTARRFFFFPQKYNIFNFPWIFTMFAEWRENPCDILIFPTRIKKKENYFHTLESDLKVFFKQKKKTWNLRLWQLQPWMQLWYRWWKRNWKSGRRIQKPLICSSTCVRVEHFSN